MGFVKKDGSTWYYQTELGKDPVTGVRKRKKKRGFKTKRDAERALAQVEAEVIRGTYIEPSNTLFKNYLEEWFKGKKLTIGIQTAKVIESYLKSRIIPSLGNIPLSKLSPLLLQKYIYELKEEGLASKTIKKVHEIIHNALEHAMDLEIIPKNVASKVKLPKDEKREMGVWDENETKRFLHIAKENRNFLAFYIALSTGMRQGEILGLRWKDINFEKNTLSINQTLMHDGKAFQVGGKTKSSNRTINLSKELIAFLRKRKAEIAKEKLIKGPDYSDLDLVICTERGTPINPSNLRRTFNRLVIKAEVPKITFHGLRHTHATTLLAKGANIKVISERLGHSNIKVTLDVYSHVLPTMQKEVVKLIDNLLSS